MNINITNSTKIFFLFLGFYCYNSPLFAYSQTPLDSIKQVLRDFNIPYEYQEDWIEDLEELEDRQDSPAFRRALAVVNEELQDYLEERNSKGRKSVNAGKIKLSKKVKKIGQNISKQIGQGVKSAEVTVPLELAKAAQKRGKYETAIEHYQTALKALEEQEKWAKAVEIQVNIANLLAIMRKNEEALNILVEVKEKMRALGDGDGMKKIDIKIATLNKKLNITPKKVDIPAELDNPTLSNPRTLGKKPSNPISIQTYTAELLEKEAEIAAIEKEMIDKANKEMNTFNRQLRSAEESNDYRRITSLNNKIRALEKKRTQDEMDVTKAKNDLIAQKLLLAEKEAELTKQALAQRNLYGGLGLLGLLVFSLFFLYRSKKRDHKKISLAYQELAVAQDELKKAEQRIKGLLGQQVSGAVANELIAGEGVKKRKFVCVMFLDIRNFTPFVESKTPEEIIEYQNNVLGFMMEKVTEHKGIVNTILGDGFMATFGAPISAGNDCLQAYKAAVQIMQMVKEKSRLGEIPPTKIGIGMHAGYVVAGNVGTKDRKQYLITGNTVIIASRLEQLNKQYGSTLVISKEVVEQLPAAMNLPKVFDQVMVKGRSKPVQIAKYG